MVSIRSIDAAEFDGPGSTAATRIQRIAAACDAADGVVTLNEQTALELKHRGLSRARLWLAEDGFALLHGSELDLAVAPQARGRGLGTALVRQLLADSALHGPFTDGGPIEAWSHADHPAAGRLAARFGLERARELRLMSRPTASPVDEPDLPAGVRIRTFTPADEADLLAVNAAAFAHHPEQGHLSPEDFRERTREPWFDPAGLFLAVPEEPAAGEPAVLGFHWTKVHDEQDPPYGEVYVVAANPRAAGRGLGRALTAIGLRHLADRGVAEVILYVDGDNEPAIALYDRLGFRTVRTEAQYRGPVPSTTQPADGPAGS